MLVQRGTDCYRAKVIGSDPQALAWGLDKALMRGAIRAQQDWDA